MSMGLSFTKVELDWIDLERDNFDKAGEFSDSEEDKISEIDSEEEGKGVQGRIVN